MGCWNPCGQLGEWEQRHMWNFPWFPDFFKCTAVSEIASPNVVCLSKHRVDRSIRLPETGSGQDSDPSGETVAATLAMDQPNSPSMKSRMATAKCSSTPAIGLSELNKHQFGRFLMNQGMSVISAGQKGDAFGSDCVQHAHG